MRLKIVRLDQDGFNGRDHAPGPQHVGQIGVMVACEVQCADFEINMTPIVYQSGDRWLLNGSEAHEAVQDELDGNDDSGVYTMFRVAMSNGDVLEVMEHEAEVVS